MNDEGVSTGPELALVQLETEIEGRHQQGLRIGRAALPKSRGDVENALPQPLREGDAVLIGMTDLMTSQLRATTHHRNRSINSPGGILW